MSEQEEIRAKQIKAARRALLDTLNIAYPGDLTFEDLCEVLPDVCEHYLQRDLMYLIEKGYVVWINARNNAGWPGRRFRLTAAGEEIAQKINVDPALAP